MLHICIVTYEMTASHYDCFAECLSITCHLLMHTDILCNTVSYRLVPLYWSMFHVSGSRLTVQ